MYDRDALRASNSARLETAFGASRMRWRSLVCGIMRVKWVRFTLVFAGSISLEMVVTQFSFNSLQPRLPMFGGVLLRYTHSFFYSSVYCGPIPLVVTMGCAGVGICYVLEGSYAGVGWGVVGCVCSIFGFYISCFSMVCCICLMLVCGGGRIFV